MGSNKRPSIKKPMYFGIVILLTFLFVFVTWGIFAPLDSAAITEGKVVVNSYKKTIQHLEGGIVDAVYVKDGDIVKKGQPLLRIDSTKSKAQRDAHRIEYYTLKAREARLLAARDDHATIVFPGELLKGKNNPEIARILQDQQAIFADNKESYEKTQKGLDNEIQLHQQEIGSIMKGIQSLKQQQAYLDKETSAVEELLKSNYVEKTRYWQLKREENRMHGMMEEMNTKVLKAKQQISDADLNKTKLANERNKRILSELYDTRNQLSTVTNQLIDDSDVLKRTLVVAPLSGVVLNLSVHTLGGVIKPGDAIMDIVPTQDELIAEVRVNPINIDEVKVGMPVKVKLLAYNQRVTPELKGKLVYISADSVTDKTTGKSYYVGRVIVDKDQLRSLKDIKLFPGMPVQAFIATSEQTFFSYLFSPFVNSFGRAFREQ